MGFNDLFNKGKQLFDDGKEKVTDFVESEKGQQMVEKSKTLFEDGKDKVTDFFDGDKSDQVSDQVFDSAADKAKKITPDEPEVGVEDIRDEADGVGGKG